MRAAYLTTDTSVQSEGLTVRITKRQLRKLISEACGLPHDEEELPVEDALPALAPEVLPPMAALPEIPVESGAPEVPVPEDYQAARGFLDMNPELTDMGIQMVMDSAGTSCERSTAQALVDHLGDLLGDAQEIEALDPTAFETAVLPGGG